MMDFRSDTVTQPTPAMKQAMLDAPLGDDVLGDDPTVNRLQQLAAEMLGFEAALLAPSGTQTNLIALMTHCQRGDEAIVGQQWHTYKWEGGGMAVLGSIQPQPLENQDDGTIALADIESAIKPDDPHFARTRLVALENTTGGKPLPVAYMRQVRNLAQQHRLATHLDGARLFNAAVALAQNGNPYETAREICQSFDSVSVCLSKGLGAPIGSLLLGSGEFISRARRVRKMLGGGMRQAGMLAAAGIYALQNNVRRLSEDHENARLLAEGLAEAMASHPKLSSHTRPWPAQTNIVFTDMDAALADDFVQFLARNGVKVTSSYMRSKGRAQKRLRWVTHLDVNRKNIGKALEIVRAF